MLSLPLIPPPSTDISTPILPAVFRPRPDSPPPQDQRGHAHHRQHQHRRDTALAAHNTRSPLALLSQDEAAILQRKAAIRNFGAFWLRPPGVGKTLQAMHEEEVERLEAEEQARQEQGLRDMEAQQQLQEAQARAAEGGAVVAGEEGEVMQEERDLDEDIPDAVAEDAEQEEVSFNEDSLAEGNTQIEAGSPGHTHIHEDPLSSDEENGLGAEAQQALEMEEAELTGQAREEEELGMMSERNLDDSVPEAGSYQHTDTEVEDSDDSDSELQDSFAVQSARRSTRSVRSQQSARSLRLIPTPSAQGSSPWVAAGAVGGAAGIQERMRAQLAAADALPRSRGSLNLSSSLLESSFVGSSPVMQRGGHAGRGRGVARRRRVRPN